MDLNTQTREEFEESVKVELDKVVDKAKQMRDEVRLLEKAIADKEQKIQKYQNTFTDLKQELVKIQAKLYAGGTI